jgi:predicted enzyme related to lactoylglutathione lyase
MLIVYPVRDLDAAKAVYTALLGTEPYADAPYYVGYRVGDLELGLDPNGHKQGRTGPLPYQDVPDAEAALRTLVAAGAKEVQPVRDVGGGTLVALVEDADGNVTGLRQQS